MLGAETNFVIPNPFPFPFLPSNKKSILFLFLFLFLFLIFYFLFFYFILLLLYFLLLTTYCLWNTRETTMQQQPVNFAIVDNVMFIIALEITVFVLRWLLMQSFLHSLICTLSSTFNCLGSFAPMFKDELGIKSVRPYVMFYVSGSSQMLHTALHPLNSLDFLIQGHTVHTSRSLISPCFKDKKAKAYAYHRKAQDHGTPEKHILGSSQQP